MLSDIITSGAMHSLKLVFQKKKERNVIIDPFSCLIKLSLIKYLDAGTKVSIYQNRLNFNEPSYVQGIVRFMYGDNREDLHNILLPLQKCVEWYWNSKNADMVYMFNNAVLGLKFLKNSYSAYATIQHTIDYYIIILMQKNTTIMNTMGINSIDIDKLTNAILESNTNSISTSPPKGLISPPAHSTHQSHTYIKEENKELATANTAANTAAITAANTAVASNNITKTITTTTSDVNNNDNSENNYSAIHNALPITNEITESQARRDIHKFLFELWNEREMNIVINLYKELENKQNSSEKNYIYNNIMQYCEMKENKLYQYIEQNSSIL